LENRYNPVIILDLCFGLVELLKRASDKETSGSGSILRIKDVVKDFGGVRAVDHCVFNVGCGTITGLIGPNGAGKTTIFNLITGFLKPSAGSIWLLDRRIDGLPPHWIFRQGVLRTFQIPRELKRMTVLENLMLVPGDQLGEKVWASWLMPHRVGQQERTVQRQALEVLDFLQLRHLADEYAGNLSTGQKKLLELARTLMARPRLVLLDEPGAGVNPSLMNVLVDDIRRTNQEKGVTFLIIEHDLDLVMRLCNPVVVMNNGATLAEGSPREVRANREVIEAYLGG
jgi:branched-chain amino acid transport system ATP-binding protein